MSATRQDMVGQVAAIGSTTIASSDEVVSWQSSPEFPENEEILLRRVYETLPHNVVDRPWTSGEAYLRAQYEILRCEATEGLRYSAASCHDKTNRQQQLWDDENTWVYIEVRIKGYLFAKMGPIVRVEFSTARAEYKINWFQSKRLTPGKIVAISTKADGFRTICKIATVAQRPYSGGLDQDPPQVDLMWADPADAEFDPEAELIMIESRHGYYEASRHALLGLQEVSQKGSPLLERLLGAQTESSHPRFILENPIVNLRPIAHQKGVSAAQKNALAAHNIVTNPMPDLGDRTTLDDSQLEAVQRILSQELAIVQGPPGTGKTFTTVEAIKIMVATRQANGGGPPIIVAAQTNHALDHLLSYCLQAGIKLVRLGGRATTPELREVGLYNLRARARFSTGRAIKEITARIKATIDKFQSLVDDAFGTKLIEPEALRSRGIISDEQYESLVDDTMESIPEIEEMGPFGLWLGDGRVHAEVLRDLHQPAQFDMLPDEEMIETPDEDGREVANIAEDEEDQDRIKGRFITVDHIWTGKLPTHLGSWTRTAEKELRTKHDLFEIPTDRRGAVYRHLQVRLLATLRPEFTALMNEYIQLCREEARLRTQHNAALIRSQNIELIGCTTTGLTKYRGLLSALSPRSLLVEEASETREANIVSALYPSVQQLILVGDHQQLAPHSDIAWLAEDPFNIHVSMFQRLVDIGMPFTMLKVQRRMKPELRSILKPFYPELTDHAEVISKDNRPDIPGMGGRNCWFYDHAWPEQTNSDHSKYNEYEAHMVAGFFAYLVANGTPADKITVLTFYTGQRKFLLNTLNRHGGLAGLRFNVCTVDSYQGKENDVILLSLVRSPHFTQAPSIGFLEDQRRAVVAISRARRGFYVFGNIENLATSHATASGFWIDIWNGFAALRAVDRQRGLRLECKNHKNATWIKDTDDWAKISGGCNRPCGETRQCGHKCTIKCHPATHDQLPCRHPCPEKLDCGDGCQRYCGEACFCSCAKFQAIKAEKDTKSAEQPKSTEQSIPTFQEQILQATGPLVLLQTKVYGNEEYIATRKTPSLPLPQPVPTGLRALTHSRLPLQLPRAPRSGRAKGRHQQPPPSVSSTAKKWQAFTDNVAEYDREIEMQSSQLRAQTLASLKETPMIQDTYQATTTVDGRREADGKKNTTEQEVLLPTMIEALSVQGPSTSHGDPLATPAVLNKTPSIMNELGRSLPGIAPTGVQHWIEHEPNTAPVYPFRLPPTPVPSSPTKTIFDVENDIPVPLSPATTTFTGVQDRTHHGVLIDFEDDDGDTVGIPLTYAVNDPFVIDSAGQGQTDLLSADEPIPVMTCTSHRVVDEGDSLIDL